DITACIAQSSRLVLSFGGHPMAAGLALEAEQLPAFRRAVAQAAGAQILAAGGLPEQALQIDGQLGLTDLTLDLVSDFERLAPFGAGNPAPVFMIRDLGISSGAVIGREREHRMLTLEDRAGNAQKVLWWGGAAWPQPEGRFDLACSLRASDFRGQREVQVEWLDARPIPEEVIRVHEPALQVIDHRGVAHPRVVLEALRAESGLVIWAEGEARDKLDAYDRSGLSPAARLAIWTTPPGRQELAAALSAVKPEVVLLFAIDPETSDPPGFLNRLTGLVKYLLATAAGEPAPVDLNRLAAATAQREAAVRCGLHWLAARGFIRLDRLEDGGLALSPGSGKPTPDDAEWMNRLKNLLDETAAYRRFFAVTEPALLNLTQS
ncbi:MAG TPA: hypothetical protein PJ988_18310, partial [Anaerolinea sp.]|nr:hypothetical protein [Anaerolinea sp.]